MTFHAYRYGKHFRVIIQGNTTVAIMFEEELQTTYKGIAKCNPNDKYNKEFGIELAIKKAFQTMYGDAISQYSHHINSFKKQSKGICNMIESKLAKLSIENE